MYKVTVDRDLKLVLFFSFIYCLLCYTLAIHWYEKSYFSVYNIFFDADPNRNLASFAHGNGRNALSHAFLEFFSFFIKPIESIFFFFSVEYNKIKLREICALAISPLFSSATLICFYKTLNILKINTFDAKIITLLFAFASSNLIFAIIPESYSISCFFISALIYYFCKCSHQNNGGNPKVWIGLATLLTGITITNIFIFILVYTIHLHKNLNVGNFVMFKQVLKHSSISGFYVLALYFSYHIIFDVSFSGEGGPSWIARFLVLSYTQMELNFINLITASLNSLFALFPETIKNDACIDFSCNKISFVRTYFANPTLLAITLGSLSIYFISKSYVINTIRDKLNIICILIVWFNFSLHVIFGREVFLYTQHWITPLFLLIVPILQNRRYLSISLLLMLVVINVNFLFDIEQLVAFE